jgi:hypothetical protein
MRNYIILAYEAKDRTSPSKKRVVIANTFHNIYHFVAIPPPYPRQLDLCWIAPLKYPS